MKIKHKAKNLHTKCDDSSKNTDIIKNDIKEPINSAKKKVRFKNSLNNKLIGNTYHYMLCHMLNMITDRVSYFV